MNTVNLFPTQPDLRLILPTVIGNVDYQCLRQTFERIDDLSWSKAGWKLKPSPKA